MLADIRASFRALPDSMKIGLLLVALSWLWLYFTLHYTNVIRMVQYFHIIFLVAAVFVALLILKMAQGKKWARIMYLFADVFIIFQLVNPFFVFSREGPFNLAIIIGVNLLLFIVSGCFILTKEATLFFTPARKHQEQESGKDTP